MGTLIESAPAQMLDALDGVEPWPSPARPPDLLVVGAMGGSAIAADLTASMYAGELPKPMLVVRDYRLPACVSGASLVLLSSYSGNTEETLALVDEARARGVPWLGLTTGGRLGEACDRAGAARRPLPPGMPPRAALYASWVAVTRLLAALGWIADPSPAWREAAAALEARVRDWGRDRGANPARRLADSLAGRPVFLYADRRLEPLATRWRNQLNENAKLLAHSAVVPELNHNEVVGWEKPTSAAAGAAVVLLRDGLETSPIEARLALTAEYLRRKGVEVVEPSAPAGGSVARAASLALLGDFVSYYLAIANGVDPTPIASLDEFKRRLSEWRAARAGGA